MGPSPQKNHELEAAWRQSISSAHQATMFDFDSRGSVDLEELYKQIQSYNKDIALLQNLVKLKLALVSPFRLHPLPTEVMSLIFLECLNARPKDLISISHVCRRWRTIALDNHPLWRHIELGWDGPGLALARSCLERSHPLPARLITQESDVGKFRDGLPCMLLKFSERWESIAIHHSAPDLHELLPQQWLFPRLSSLQLLDYGCNALDFQSISEILHHNSNITHLSLSGSNFEPDGWKEPEILTLRHSAKHVTHLTLADFVPVEQQDSMPADIMVGLLAAFPNLESFECHHAQNLEGLESIVLSLPVLRDLSLGDGNHTCLLLRFLDVPRLQSLRIFRPRIEDQHQTSSYYEPRILSPDDQFGNLFRSHLEELRKNCKPHLTKLVWECTSRHWSAMEPVLASFSTIEEVEFHAVDVTQMSLYEVLLGKLHNEEQRRLAPNLRTLTFSSCQGMDFPYLATLIEERNGSTHDSKVPLEPVKRVNIKDCPALKGEDWNRIAALL